MRLPHPCLQYLLELFREHLGYLQSRIRALEEHIEETADSELYAPSVTKLKVFKGINTPTAMVLIAEITDFRRFPNSKALMAFLGLIPSGEKRKGGGITKSGNHRCRKIVIESVQHYAKTPRISKKMRDHLVHLDVFRAHIAIKCLKRLDKRYRALSMKANISPVVITSIAREFVGFIWAMMQPDPATA